MVTYTGYLCAWLTRCASLIDVKDVEVWRSFEAPQAIDVKFPSV